MPDRQEIVSRDGDAVWRTAYRYLGNRADADECFQEAFLAAWEKKVGELPDAETLRVVQSLTRVLMATKNLKGGYGYKSDGVKLGDADKILVWYRPEGSTQYRALYGDLHAADVTEDKLPEKPKP